MEQLYAILVTLLAGLFFLVGGLISLKSKNKTKLNLFSISLSFIIIIGLIIMDIAPEVLELLESVDIPLKVILIIGFIFLGVGVLKILDLFIPHHTHHHSEEDDDLEEHYSHVSHIGTLTIISLILHNLIEGFAIFGMTLNDFKTGLLISISIALHNIPLGTQIFSSIDVKKNKILISILVLSSLFGGLIFLIIGNISNVVLGIMLAITLGMLLYILFGELMPEIVSNKKKKETIYGFFIGIIILLISSFL